MNMRLLPNVIRKVVINMGNGKIVRSQQLDKFACKFEPLNDFRNLEIGNGQKRKRRLKCDGMDPRLSEMNELWDKRLTISMHIEDNIVKIFILEIKIMMEWIAGNSHINKLKART